ncbi:unnamed protein product, partial [marine sediment metagenome]
TVTKLDLNGNDDFDDPAESDQPRFVTFADPYDESQGYVHNDRYYYVDSKGYGHFEGTDYDPTTQTYIPAVYDVETGFRPSDFNIRIDATYGRVIDGEVFLEFVYADLNGDGRVNIRDIDSDESGDISDIERNKAAVATDYNEYSGRYEHRKNSGLYFDGQGNLYPGAYDEEPIGIKVVYYQDRSFSFEKEVPGINPTHFVLPDGEYVDAENTKGETVRADVGPDEQGGYFVRTFEYQGQTIGGEEISDKSLTSFHFVVQSD